MTPVVIVAALNGGYQQSTDVTRVPVTPKEIAEEAEKCREAGASVVHFHARDAEGVTTGDVQIFSETIRLIRERTDVLIQTTNGIGARKDKRTGEWIRPTDSDRLALLNIQPRPELFGAATGSMDFYHPWGGQPVERPFVNSADWLCKAIQYTHRIGATIEFEVITSSVLYRLKRFADEGVFDANADYLWLLHGGGFGGTPPVPRMIIQCIDEGKLLFPNAKWGIVGAGPDQFKLATLGLACGCDSVRVGLEDNIYHADGRAAATSRDLVREIVDIASIYGRKPATPAEAREMLGLNRMASS